ncbi:hypothetical protein CDAR_563641 [Caerostris darwini]|uniref:Uncharacterized protein n=1 Tax=Caerostris darwini TaxID=1538125 RepID=A0AAV4VCV2_9ARAC|nr:hypothetical protein CDAR_563641 [Caerostris darwini]
MQAIIAPNCSDKIISEALLIDTKTNLSPSKDRCLISGGLKMISSQIVTQLAPRTCHRNHFLITTWLYTGDTFQENPSALFQTQPSRQPSKERNLAICRVRISTELSELGLDYIKRAELCF